MRDLFGEVAVSIREMQLWLFKVPRLPHYATRRTSYARQWNIASKIARAKLAGELDSILGDESCEFCGQTLCQEQADILPPVQPSVELARLRRRVKVLDMVIDSLARYSDAAASSETARGSRSCDTPAEKAAQASTRR